MSNFLYSATEWLSHRLMRREYVETQLAIARRRDPKPDWLGHGFGIGPGLPPLDLDNPACICGDPACELPWQDGGATAPGEGHNTELWPGEGRK